jgi:Icc-related predicted phosphoesterase
MRIQIFSDLHVDVFPVKPITIATDVDLVVAAGDTCEGVLRAFEHLRRIVPISVPVVMVMGNHEFYRRFIFNELALARSQASAFNIHLLDNDTVILGGVRFTGGTLWSDYQIFGQARQVAAMGASARGLNDHRLIGWQKKPWLRFRPQEAAQLHQESKAYLVETLSTAWDGPTVVVSHHAVSWSSVDPGLRSDLLTAAYVSDLSSLIEATRPDLWVHGHVHRSSDYRIGQTRILCNPQGYGNENARFDGALVVEIGV